MTDQQSTDILARLDRHPLDEFEAGIADDIRDARAEIAELRSAVIAFGGPWAVEWARRSGLPEGHLHAGHYDILARAGARMDAFVRAEPTDAE